MLALVVHGEGDFGAAGRGWDRGSSSGGDESADGEEGADDGDHCCARVERVMVDGRCEEDGLMVERRRGSWMGEQRLPDPTHSIRKGVYISCGLGAGCICAHL